jgi:hypothetical protein
MLRRSAGWVAGWNRVPTSLRAVCGYYADSGVFDYRSLTLKRRVDDRVAAMLDEAFAAVEAAIAEEFGRDAVDFSYDTKLVLPAKLTLGYLYRELDEAEHQHAEAMTQLSVEALVDGDIRDALNDDEFEDFEVDFPTGTEDRRVIAACAQTVLQDRVEDQLSDFPEAVRDAYDWAVDISEAHQDEDDAFRELMAAAQEGDDAARESIRSRYKYADFDEEPTLFTEEDLEIPYLKTQYDRVGIIYDAMIEMYRSADLPIERAFQRSIVLAIIGAQIWLDDIDDYQVDMADGQLTPVTAEYLLATAPETARDEVVDIGRTYLDRAKAEATVADSALTGIATEYILRDGTPETLPGGQSR